MKLLFTAALCVHWFNPLVWVMFLLVNRDIELACDEAVVKESGGGTKSDYAMALIGLEERKSRLMPLCNSFSKNAIEERIKAVMKSKKITIPAILAAVVIVAAVTLVFATSKATPGVGAGTRTNSNAVEQAEIAELLQKKIEEQQKEIAGQQMKIEEQLKKIAEQDEQLQLISEETWVWPCPGSQYVTSRYGMRFHPVLKEYIFSDHIDIGAQEGAAVVTVRDGTVYDTGFDDEQGNYIVIDHDDDVQTVYRYLGEQYVSAGDTVAAGNTIGTVGLTGNVTGPCLSFGVRVNGSSVNPLRYYEDYVVYPKGN